MLYSAVTLTVVLVRLQKACTVAVKLVRLWSSVSELLKKRAA